MNKEKAEHCLSKGYNTFHTDFLTFITDKKYDRIIAAPPFKGNVDVIHIQKMFSHLGKHGILVSLTSPYWLTNNEKHQIRFREWLKDKEYYLTMLPDNSFIEKDKSVPTAIIKMFNKKVL